MNLFFNSDGTIAFESYVNSKNLGEITNNITTETKESMIYLYGDMTQNERVTKIKTRKEENLYVIEAEIYDSYFKTTRIEDLISSELKSFAESLEAICIIVFVK